MRTPSGPAQPEGVRKARPPSPLNHIPTRSSSIHIYSWRSLYKKAKKQKDSHNRAMGKVTGRYHRSLLRPPSTAFGCTHAPHRFTFNSPYLHILKLGIIYLATIITFNLKPHSSHAQDPRSGSPQSLTSTLEVESRRQLSKQHQ